MRIPGKTICVLCAISLVPLALTGCQTARTHQTGTGAVTGGLIGGGIGAAIDDDNPFRGALIGTVAGAAIGAGVGHMLKKQKEALNRIEELEVQQQRIILEQPPQPAQPGQPAPAPVQTETEALLVRVPAEVLFAKDSATLSPHGAQKIREVAQVLLEYPESDVYIRGYTSSEGDLDYNYRLSQQRADMVKMELTAAGVNATRLYAQGMGPANPVASNDTEGGRAQNRRVELNIVPRTS